MLRTILVGSSVSIQGQFVRATADGKMVVKVDGQLFVGRPVSKATAC